MSEATGAHKSLHRRPFRGVICIPGTGLVGSGFKRVAGGGGGWLWVSPYKGQGELITGGLFAWGPGGCLAGSRCRLQVSNLPPLSTKRRGVEAS